MTCKYCQHEIIDTPKPVANHVPEKLLLLVPHIVQCGHCKSTFSTDHKLSKIVEFS